MESLERKIEKQEKILEKKDRIIKSYEEFLELWQELPKSIKKTKKLEKLDSLLEKVFLNFWVEGKEVTKFSLKHPFNKLVSEEEYEDVTDCRV